MRSRARTLRGLAALSAAAALTVVGVANAQPAPQASAAAATAPAADYQDLPDGTLTKKSLVVGVDGAAFHKVDELALPAIDALRAQGVTAPHNLYGTPMAGTISGPGWSSIATGVWPDKHKVVDNNFTNPDYATYPDYQTRLETANPSASTLVVGTWNPIPEIVFGEKVDVRVPGGSDDGTTAKAADYLKNGNPDSTFVHLDDVDGAGHACGTGCSQYADALKRADRQIGELVAAVKARPSYPSEQWLITVTADHGHTPTGGHGGSTPGERQDFVVAAGPGIPAGSTRYDVKIVDIAPTVLAHEGVATDPEWNLDGQALADLAPDDFDTLRPALQTQVDETRPGASVKGWTHTAPDGWSIDNSAMPAGGITEWRGWSFATDEFWTNVELGQKRETSVRNRNVFAVADSDEWDDKAHDPGQFDSTLVSPAYPIAGTGQVRVSYATNYQVDGPQTGDVYAVWNGGEPVLVKSYRENLNTHENLALTPPAGATSLKLRFRYTGTNSYFWTVDQVQVQQRQPSQLAVWAIQTTTRSVDEPGIATPWRIDARIQITNPTGRRVPGATVTAVLRFDGHATKLTGVTGPSGVVHLRGYAMYADTAELEVIEVAKGSLPYYGEADKISKVTLQRPTER